MKNSTKHFLRKNIPYFLALFLCLLTFSYTTLFITYDFDGHYGKYIGRDAYNFALRSPSGDEKTLNDYRGRYIFLTFGFTECTGVCPLNLYRFKKLAKLFQTNDIDMQFLFISFDDIRDTSKEMTHFIDNFQITNLEGLLSGRESGEKVAQEYMNVFSYDEEKIKKQESYQINHNGFLYLINPQGKLSLVYMQKEINENEILKDVLRLKMTSGEQV